MIAKAARFTLVVGAALLTSACAKFPAGGADLFTKRIIVTVKLEGAVKTGGLAYRYIVPLRLSTVSNPTDDGPKPVTSDVNVGNGFVAGNCTHYIEFNPNGSNPYEIWKFKDATLNERSLTGYAISRSDPRDGRQPNVLQFEVDLSQLVPTADVPSILSIQANVLTMDDYAREQDGHGWDALGDGLIPSKWNNWILLDTRTSRKYTNTNFQTEPPSGDPDFEDVVGLNGSPPELNIADWTFEIQLQQ
ncbi:MAG: hypothetical protein JST30_13915 [Armatimonadetes bacterium]|nr:hypothetical protein [Armatimonadota bacterium]